MIEKFWIIFTNLFEGLGLSLLVGCENSKKRPKSTSAINKKEDNSDLGSSFINRQGSQNLDVFEISHEDHLWSFLRQTVGPQRSFYWFYWLSRQFYLIFPSLHFLTQSFTVLDHTWYLSQISQIRFVEKNLSCGENSDLYAW